MNPNHHDHHHHLHKKQPINLKSLRTRFALKFLKSLKKISLQQNKQTLITHQNPINNNLSNMVAPRVSRVKMAADVSMASAVGPRRAWARAVLVRRARAGRRRGRVGRARELRRLVPGGEAMDMQSLLDETAHYIKCLSTQVSVMKCILNYCSNSTAQQVIN